MLGALQLVITCVREKKSIFVKMDLICVVCGDDRDVRNHYGVASCKDEFC